jgi:hypothetical protein
MNPIKTPTQLRLTQDLLERADALIAVMAADPEVRALGMPTRTAVTDHVNEERAQTANTLNQATD